MIGEPQEAEEKNAYHGAQQDGIGPCPAGQSQPVDQPECDDGTQHKGADIKKEEISAKDRGICIEENGDQQGSG